MRHLHVGLFVLALDGMLVHRRVTPSLLAHIYNTWLERGILRVKCLAQVHKAMSSGRTRTNHEATVPAMLYFDWHLKAMFYITTKIYALLLRHIIHIFSSLTSCIYYCI